MRNSFLFPLEWIAMDTFYFLTYWIAMDTLHSHLLSLFFVLFLPTMVFCFANRMDESMDGLKMDVDAGGGGGGDDDGGRWVVAIDPSLLSNSSSMYGQNLEYSKLSMGPLWAEIMDHILPVVNDDSNTNDRTRPPAKLAVYSGHDTTIMAILSSLGPKVWSGKEWPPYASMILIEVRVFLFLFFHCILSLFPTFGETLKESGKHERDYLGKSLNINGFPSSSCG